MSKSISLITVICLLALTGLAQSSKKLRFSCSYGEGNHGAELCEFKQRNPFASNQQAERAVDRILKPLGLKPNFVLVSCPNISNAEAVTLDGEHGDGIRYVLYDNAFIEGIDRNSNTNWASVSILAHEIGHHLNGHTTLKAHNPPTREELQHSRQNELEADEFSGFALFKLGATLAEAQAAMMALHDIPDPEENYDHPKRWRRLEAIKMGYNNAKSQQPVDNTNSQPTSSSLVGTWEGEITETGFPIKIVFQINADGTYVSRWSSAYRTYPLRRGFWRYSDGILDQGSSSATVTWIDSNHIVLTIIENEDGPRSKGRTRHLYRQVQ